MPMQKPSPHRFIAPNPPSAQTPKPKPKSNLRHAISAHTPKQTPELQFKKITPAKRFVAAPAQRLHAGDATPRAPDRVEEPSSSTPSVGTPRPKAQRKLERVESIEEASQSSPSRAPDDDALDIVHTIEHEVLSAEDEPEHHSISGEAEDDDDDDEILFVSEPRSKRRRTSPPSLSLQPLPAAASHRFRFAPAQPPLPSSALNALALPTTTTATATPPAPPSRPHFILPALSASPAKPPKPLPEIFSPSRKTHKYVPHGLASTVQTWIIETAHTGFAAQERSVGVVWGREKEDGVRLKFKVATLGQEGVQEVECFAGSMLFVRGDMQPAVYNASTASSTTGEEDGMGILLAGQGGARGSGRVKMRLGDVVGIRAPTWTIHVGGEKWAVGVDWLVL